jgi:allantoicase
MAFEKVMEIIKESPPYTQLTDLAAERLGGKVFFATDDFFAEKENLIKPGRGIFIADKYTDRGKWMDGWESRRKRVAGHDWCVVGLATPGKIIGFDIDTNFFLGNHPPFASVEGILLEKDANPSDWDALEWKRLLSKSSLDPGSQNFYESESEEIFSHVRLHIYPDGGVARFRVYGEVNKNWNEVKEEIDLAAAINGGKALLCNDMFFSAMSNLIMPGRGINMGDGWETKRNRKPGNKDWVILKLATPGFVKRITVDTHHFKGNYPDSCSLEGCFSDNDQAVIQDWVQWHIILPKQKLTADAEHEFSNEITGSTPFSHVRLNIFPDGGVSRLRLFGTIKD